MQNGVAVGINTVEYAGDGSQLSAVAIVDRALRGDLRTMGVAVHFAVYQVVSYINQVAFASVQRFAGVVWGTAACLEVRLSHPFQRCCDVWVASEQARAENTCVLGPHHSGNCAANRLRAAEPMPEVARPTKEVVMRWPAIVAAPRHLLVSLAPWADAAPEVRCVAQ